MTILDQITREVQGLSAKQRREALRVLRAMRGPNGIKPSAVTPPFKTLGAARKTLRAVKGMWRDRTDLPADTVDASIELRRRLMRRSKNG